MIFKKYIKILFVLIFSVMINDALANDKWVIITTINYPTKAFDILSKLDDWSILVVADKKTPKDWNFPGVTVLTVEDQLRLNYNIMQHIPWNHYGRKNIGYLYAISCGAKIIYETDDDNFLLNGEIDLHPEYSEWVAIASDTVTTNPYAYFDQPTVWPRGYPLKDILKPDTASWSFQKNIFIPIQQGLVDQDPDVDAIFRLTRPEVTSFPARKMPLVLDKGVMAPFNSQNTVFYYSAFWGLLIPCSVSGRVADIWRGYISQRLLWDLEAHLCFIGSYAFQERNEHDLLKDFIDEMDLYLKTDQLITVLNQKFLGDTLQVRMLSLFEHLFDNSLIKQADLDLAYAWLQDLESVGYKFPAVQ
jgi:STELLO glycosyltransferases